MARTPISTRFFVLVVVRRGDRFLLVREAKHDQRWYVPAGRSEPGEHLDEAARRETDEEAGLPIILDGVVRIEHTPMPDGTARLRVIFTAHPADDRDPKTEPDDESLGADWFTLDEMSRIPLRGPEVLAFCRYVADGEGVMPLHVLTQEGAPLVG